MILSLVLCPAIILGTRAVGGEPQNDLVDPPSGIRDKLTVQELTGAIFSGLIHNDYFMPVGEVLPAAHQLSGVIQFEPTRMTTSHPDGNARGSGHQWFPALSLPVISQGDYLIPLERGIIYCGDERPSFWNIIVSPGRVWREAADGGYSRASFPFVLTDNYVGQARNGLATFVFDSTGISPVAIQISQETAPVDSYTTANFAGMIPALYTPHSFPDADRHILDFHAEIATRPSIRPWTELPYGVFTQRFFKGGLTDETVSLAALLVEGRLFLQPAETRTGRFPYPAEMRHGVFSVTKTLGMGLAMFWAAERYGEGVFNELITDNVPFLSGHPGWQGVTFENVFDMATGTSGGDSGSNIAPFIAARSAEEKLAAMSALPDAPSQPGQVFNYASTNTFVLSCALNEYVKSKEGPEADYWEMIREEVLRPLGIPHLPLVRTLEEGGKPGIPIMGWGSYPTVCEAAKIAQLVHDEGEFQGVQLLNRNKVREALYRTSRRGLDAGISFGHHEYYLHSMWITGVNLSNCSVYASSMRGHGGNHVTVLPSGAVAVRFGDQNLYDVAPMVAVAEFYKTSCPDNGRRKAQAEGPPKKR
jgi:CubicO group peptidase (beta-lactamase class C family)